MGPNVKRLVATRMAQVAIPKGCPDPFKAGVEMLVNPAPVAGIAIEFVKSAWRTASDEEIATKIMRRIDEILEKRK